jgi:hypothetical protein
MADRDFDGPTDSTIAQPESKPGPFRAKVVAHGDSSYGGKLKVQLLHDVGNSDREGETHDVMYMSPFFGRTDVKHNGKDNDYNNTQKSYGFWAVPPDVGSTVVVIFIEGNPKRGYWFGCIQDEDVNFMLPGYAATENNVEGGLDTPYGHAARVPVAEYNKNYPSNNSTGDKTKIKKPAHPFAQQLADQGLLLDDTRGITTSSARREFPSMVFGISTPGPLDKRSGAQTGAYGTSDHQIRNAPVSRLGGSSFVMDDGDDHYLRKSSPSKSGPDYAAVEENETGGDVTRPHNELIRLRTRTGHQILLHNSEDLIYITNSRGTAWIELTSDGKIDVYAQDSISMHTEQDFNFYAGRDFNFEAGRNFNTKVTGEHHTHVLKDQILIVDGNQTIKIAKDVNKTYEQKYTHTVQQSVNKVYNDTFLHHVVGQVDWTFDASLNWNTGVAGGGDVNASFGGNVTTKVAGTVNETIVGSVIKTIQGSFDLNTSGHNNFTAGATTNIKSSGDHIETAANIHMNGPAATTAAIASAPGTPTAAIDAELPKVLQTSTLPGPPNGAELVQSIMRRVPTTEPYPQHENLDPEKYKPSKTDRDADTRYEGNSTSMADAATYWKKYTTNPDTFTRNPPVEDSYQQNNEEV